jgi:hypothetical protein
MRFSGLPAGPAEGAMTRCVLCSTPVEDGILCDRCDKPLRSRDPVPAQTASVPAPESEPREFPAEVNVAPLSLPGRPEVTRAEADQILDLLEVPGLVFDSSGRLVSMTREAREILRYGPGERPGTLEIETRLGVRVTKISDSGRHDVSISGSEYLLGIVLLSGGAEGRVVVLRPKGAPTEDVQLSFLLETVIGPLRSLNATLKIAARQRGSDHLLTDTISTIDQALSSLELSPEFASAASREPAGLILETLKARYESAAVAKGISLQLDTPSPEIETEDVRGISNAIGVYLENSLRYVPRGGQIVLGVRPMEHRGNPVLLFFVMDNGPVIPQEKRESVYSPDFRPGLDPAVRTASRFAEVRGYAMSRGGKAWMESKTGKASTFFLTVAAG